MKNTKRSITIKVIFGYLLISALALFAVWFIYGQIVTISETAEKGNLNNQKLFLVSEAATNLFVAEGISRDIIQNQNVSELPRFRNYIDTISIIVDSLKVFSDDLEMNVELDSIKSLLNQKTTNLEELLALRKEATTESYYSRVIENLQKVDDIFEDDDYEYQLRNVHPSAREAIIGLIEYSKRNREEELTQRTADSLVNALKFVLSNLETQERRIMFSINQKENELLENDRIISNQLQDLRAAIEQEEIQKSIVQVEESRKLIEQTSLIIGGVGIVSVLTIFLFVVLIFKDTNRSQKYRQQLEASKDYTEALLKSREQIMAAVTHDLRSPLNAVIGYSDLLGKSELSEKQVHYLQNLRTSSNYILRLVNDLLDLSKLEAGKMHIENLRFNVEKIIEESVKNAIPENSKNLLIKITVEKSLQNDIVSDPLRLKQILTNLISNAYKFTHRGEIAITASLKKVKKNPNTLYIKVKDTGIGVSKAQQKQIFDEFTQADENIEKQYGGYGLGLAITKKIVTLLNGHIFVESKPGAGATFFFYIPIDFAAKSPDVFEEASAQVAAPIHLNTKKVLIIDDEEAQRTLTSEILSKTNIITKTTNSALKALTILENESFDFVLTDIQMPEMDGFELLKNIRKNDKIAQLPVIALSGNTDFSNQEYLEKGFYAKLTKPYSPEKLLKLLGEKINVANTVESKTTHGDFYNLGDVLLFTQGDKESLKAVLESFIVSTNLNLIEFENALQNKDDESIKAIAHKMLPMFRQLKIECCIDFLEKAENLDESIFSEITNGFSKFKIDLIVILNKLQFEIKV